MMLQKNTKAMVHSPDSDTNFFDIVAGIFLPPYIILNYILYMSKDLIKERKIEICIK